MWLWSSRSLSSWSKHLQLEQAFIQPRFEYSRDKDSATSLGNLFQHLTTLIVKGGERKKEEKKNFYR